jgi:hypothetical protein
MIEIKDTPPTVPAMADIAMAMDDLLIHLDELNALVEEENRILARGLPASLSKFTDRKNELAEEFERWVKIVAANQLAVWTANEAQRARLTAAITRLRAGMDENVERLRAAMEASRRRIDAVMTAIKSEIRTNTPYDAQARLSSATSSRAYGGPGVQV